MSAFVNHCFFNARETVEDHSPSAALDIVDGCLCKGEGDSSRDSIFVDCTQSVRHIRYLEGGRRDLKLKWIGSKCLSTLRDWTRWLEVEGRGEAQHLHIFE